MAEIRLKLSSAGFRTVLTSPRVLADLQARAERVRQAAGVDHHVVDSAVGKNRARAAVITSTDHGKRQEAEDRNLTRAFDAAR